MRKQKTWTDLFGPITEDHVVDGCYVSKKIGPNNYVVVHICETETQALTVLAAWRQEN